MEWPIGFNCSVWSKDGVCWKEGVVNAKRNEYWSKGQHQCLIARETGQRFAMVGNWKEKKQVDIWKREKTRHEPKGKVLKSIIVNLQCEKRGATEGSVFKTSSGHDQKVWFDTNKEKIMEAKLSPIKKFLNVKQVVLPGSCVYQRRHWWRRWHRRRFAQGSATEEVFEDDTLPERSSARWLSFASITPVRGPVPVPSQPRSAADGPEWEYFPPLRLLWYIFLE